MHGTAGIQAQAVGQAGARATVIGTGGPAIMRGTWVITWGRIRKDRETMLRVQVVQFFAHMWYKYVLST